MSEITVAELAERIADLEREIGRAVAALSVATDRASQVTQMALARMGAHFTIDDAAVLLGVAPISVKRKIKRGELTLEQIPGTKVYGIPADEVFAWAPAKVLRKTTEREKR